MKAKVEFHQPKKGDPDLPVVFMSMREEQSRKEITEMITYGVEKIVANYVNLGLKSWSNIGYTAMNIAPPKAIQDARNFMLRQMADRIIQFGILEITLYPTMSDLRNIQGRWAALEGKKDEAPGIPLNIETDPVSPEEMPGSAGPVLPDLVQAVVQENDMSDNPDGHG